MDKKYYFRYDNGRIGSLKYRSAKQQLAKDSTQILHRAIYGMLPKNRQRSVRLNQRVVFAKDNQHKLTQKLIPLEAQF